MFVPLFHLFLFPSNNSIVLTDLFPLSMSFLATRSETCYPNFNELPTPKELPDLKWKKKKLLEKKNKKAKWECLLQVLVQTQRVTL